MVGSAGGWWWERFLWFIVVLLDIVQQPGLRLHRARTAGLPAHQPEMLGADADASAQRQAPATAQAHAQHAAPAADHHAGGGGCQHVMRPALAALPLLPVGVHVVLYGV